MPARHENRQRLMEIVEVVRRHEIIKGLTPEKLCAALVAAALLVCGALLRDVAPLAGGLSWLTVFCFLLSAALLGWAFVWKDQKK